MKLLEIVKSLIESELKFFDKEKGHYSLSGKYVFIRFGLPNMDDLGNYKKSYCYVGGKDKLYEESGISVFEAFKVKGKNKYYILGGGHILNTSYDELNNTNREPYLVDGIQIDEGSDGEPLLDICSFKVIKKLEKGDIKIYHG
jgi:hypothetical protein